MALLPADFWEQEKRRLLAVLLPEVTAAAQAGLESANRQSGLGLNLELANQAAADWAAMYTDDLLQTLGTTSERLVGEALAEWVQKPGSTMADLVNILEPRFGRNIYRADLIAVTETTRVYASGNRLAYERAGITHWRWKTNRDEMVCKHCGKVNNTVRRIGEPFAFWRGKAILHPPFHPGCRCWITPVVGGQAV